MDDELKQLIEDAAKLLGYRCQQHDYGHTVEFGIEVQPNIWKTFDPLNPERGDLMKVAEAAGLGIDFEYCRIYSATIADCTFSYTKGDYQSRALAILRAASAVWKARNLDDLSQSSEDLGGY